MTDKTSDKIALRERLLDTCVGVETTVVVQAVGEALAEIIIGMTSAEAEAILMVDIVAMTLKDDIRLLAQRGKLDPAAAAH